MPRIRATVAQISDLHMNRRVDPDVVSMLKRVLAKIEPRPDILLVSGDLSNQPVMWQMRKAARLVDEIRKSLECRDVFVIPGNHDFKFWGNIGLRRLTRIPFEIYFRRRGLHESPMWRIKAGFRLTLNALCWNGKAMLEPVFHRVESELGLVIFAVNSNTLSEMMAAGEVIPKDLQELYKQYDEEAKSIPNFEFLYKIALVHHHPAPIANAPYDAIARVQDTFMIFYNAGLFVRELSRLGFNLVVHGHKHVAGFLRVQCEFLDLGRTVLPIAAAGTATHPKPDDSRGHHLRIIRIFDDDTAVLEDQFFSADVEKKDESCSYQLQTIDDVRRSRYRAFERLQKYKVSEIVKTVEITTQGFSKITVNHRGCRATTTDGLQQVPIELTTRRPSYLRGFAEKLSSFGSVKCLSSELHKFKGNFDLFRAWKPSDGVFDFEYSYRLMNGHALTKEEVDRHYSSLSLDFEWSAVKVHEACDLLTLDVKFPDGSDTSCLLFRAFAEYVPAPLQGVNDDRLNYADTKSHEDETARITGGWRVEGSRVVLTCSQPIPGMIYKISWRFRDVVGKIQPVLSATALVETAREKLLQMAKSKDHAGLEQVKSTLLNLANDLNSTLSGSPEEFSVSLMVFDEKTQRLQFVGTTGNELSPGDFYSGEGCAGYAFEKAMSIIYHPARDAIGYFIQNAERPDVAQHEEPIVLLSIPWIHSSGDQQQIVVGVVNISSMLKTTKLLDIFDRPDEDKLLSLQALANLWAKKLLFDIMTVGQET